MDQQKEAIERTRLLNSKGRLRMPSWAAGDLFEYNKDKIRMSFTKTEWEYYRLGNSRFSVQLFYGHYAVFGVAKVLLVDFESGKEYTAGAFVPFCGDRFDLDFSAHQPHGFLYDERDFYISAGTNARVRTIRCRSKQIEVDIACRENGETIEVASPFDRKKQFALSLKEFFFDIRGKVSVEGIDYTIDDNTFLVLESFRGVLPHRTKRIWGSGAVRFGEETIALNLGWGLGNTRYGNENAIFLDHSLQKLSVVRRKIHSTDKMQASRFEESNSRLNVIFTPEYCHIVKKKVLFFQVNIQQFFGTLSGEIYLFEGEKIKVSNMPFMLELMNNHL